MEKLYLRNSYVFNAILLFIVFSNLAKAQTLTSPQVNFIQRTAIATPAKTIYNIKGDFTMFGNTNLTLSNYSTSTDNQGSSMKYVDIDGDSNTLNSSMATLELTNGGENSANQNCSTVIFAGLYWTGRSSNTDTFTVSTATHGSTIPNTNYTLNVTRGGSTSNRYPIYTFTGNGHTYIFSFTNNISGSSIVTLKIDSGATTDYPVSYNSGTATFTSPFISNPAFGTSFTLTGLTRDTGTNVSELIHQTNSYASINNYLSKNYNKKVISLKGPGAPSYTSITSNSDVYFPGTTYGGIFVGYQDVTDYVKSHGAGAYTVADIALVEGINGSDAQNPGYSGGWTMVVVYENPVMKSRAVTLFDGYAYVNGQRSGGGEFGNIPISGFTTVDSGPVKMKLGVMAAEGDRNLTGDYLEVQNLNTTIYSKLNHDNNSTTNFFNSSIFPSQPLQSDISLRNPNNLNNTGVDFSMFTIPNTDNLVIGNNQTSTTFRFGSTSDVFTIFGFAMSVDAYVPEPKGLISVNSINNVTNSGVLNALPGQAINYSLAVSNSGTEAINNSVIKIPIPKTAIFNTGGIISYSTKNGFSTSNIPYYDSGTNSIIWDLGTLPITSGHPEYIYADLGFNLNVTTDCNIIINEGCNPKVSLQTGSITGVGAISGTPTAKYFFQGYDQTACKKPIDGSIIVAIDGTSCLTTLAGNDQVTSCGLQRVTLGATSGSTGKWSIVNGPAGGNEIFSNDTSPNSEFYSPNDGIYTLKWTVSGGGQCPDISDDVQINLNPCNHIDFDGVDDNVNFKNNFNLNSGSFSFETWIKSETTNGNIQTILSKRNASNLNDGYDLRLVNNTISFNWNNGNSISSSYAISTGRWYHVAVTYNGTNYNLYIDGVSVRSAIAGENPIANSNATFILGAMAQNTVFPYNPINHFDGWMQELRIWNLALTDAQIHQMMNQKIQQNNGSILGSTVPLTISGLSWSNLEGYYQMVQATDLNSGYLIDKSTNIRNGRLLNIYTPQPETAPLPYTSVNDGAWETSNTWTHGDVWNIPNTAGINNTTFIDWNIVKTDNNITTAGNKTILGLLVTSNTLNANSNNKIEVSHYLKLNGIIDLVNKSQLVQTQGSVLDVSSSGSINRDQQGQSNLYNYNYWSAPVGAISTTANNVNYSIESVMKDGTTSTPRDIQWIGGYNGAPTTPISTARYWLYKFDNYANAYASWVRINENSTIRVGQGYTMKGSGAPTSTQNYTFIGKPNNGLINSNSVSNNQLLLAGNPYPSSLDSETFIKDNESSINGNIYFWEHYASNKSHFLKDYQGGYAIRNLTGGIAPSSANVDFISKLGTPSRGIPNRFIPVGQAFLVIGKSGAGGTITYNNNQRAFHKEDDSENSNVIFKTTTSTKILWRNSDNDVVSEEKHKKIRLGFTSHDDYHRQILLGFIDGKATDAIDYGYDAYNMDNFPNDMFFIIGGDHFLIQGVGTFDKKASYPIAVKTNAEGTVKFMIDEVDNFDTNQAIYIFDSETNTYHNIRENNFEIKLIAGTNSTRFHLRFYNPADAPIEPEIPIEELDNNSCKIIHIQKSDNINVSNSFENSQVKKIRLYNSSGIEIENWKIQENRDQSNIQVHIKKKKVGTYIVKVETTKGDFTKKIIIQ